MATKYWNRGTIVLILAAAFVAQVVAFVVLHGRGDSTAAIAMASAPTTPAASAPSATTADARAETEAPSEDEADRAERDEADSDDPDQAAQVRFVVDPAAAALTLDGERLGPMSDTIMEVDPGRHDLEATLAGFQRVRAKFDAQAGRTTTVRIRLKPTRATRRRAAPVVAAAPTAEPEAVSVETPDVDAVAVESEPTEEVITVEVEKSPPATKKKVKRRRRRRRTSKGVATPRVAANADGDAARGKKLLGARCIKCHSVSGSQFSKAQWQRFFASGSHDRFAKIGREVSAKDLTSIKTYLEDNAADRAKNQGAGVKR